MAYGRLAGSYNADAVRGLVVLKTHEAHDAIAPRRCYELAYNTVSLTARLTTRALSQSRGGLPSGFHVTAVAPASPLLPPAWILETTSSPGRHTSTAPAPLSHVAERSTVGELTGRPGGAGRSNLVSLKSASVVATMFFAVVLARGAPRGLWRGPGGI